MVLKALFVRIVGVNKPIGMIIKNDQSVKKAGVILYFEGGGMRGNAWNW